MAKNNSNMSIASSNKNGHIHVVQSKQDMSSFETLMSDSFLSALLYLPDVFETARILRIMWVEK